MRHGCACVVGMKYAVRMCGDVAILLFASRPSLFVVLEAREARETLKTGGRSSGDVARTLARVAVGRARTAHAAATHAAEGREGDERNLQVGWPSTDQDESDQ